MKPSPEYAVSLSVRNGCYTPVIHTWERNMTSEMAFRDGASSAKLVAETKAIGLAQRLQVPYCASPGEVSEALARYVVRMSAGHLAANNLKADVLARRPIGRIAEQYGLPEHTVRSIREILATVRSTVR